MPADRPARRLCVFTSAGDRNAVAGWLPPDRARDFDLLVAFYGEDEARHAELVAIADRCWRIKGGKYQNLWTLVRRGEIDLAPYSHVWVADDDLLLDPEDVPRLFDLAARYDLHVCQPAFDPAGRISWRVTRFVPGSEQLRLTDFVEETCPLFRRDRLEAFLEVYDGSVAGYGVDLWFSHHLGAGWNGRFAVIDAITVINPRTETKAGGMREIDRVAGEAERMERWQAAKHSHGILRAEGRTIATLPLPPGWQEADRLPGPVRARLRELFGPAPGCVLCLGVADAAVLALRAGARLVVALEQDGARLAAARGRSACAQAEREGRLVLVQAGPDGAQAPWDVLASRGDWPDMVVVDHAEAGAVRRWAREAARPPGRGMPRLAMVGPPPGRQLRLLDPGGPAAGGRGQP